MRIECRYSFAPKNLELELRPDDRVGYILDEPKATISIISFWESEITAEFGQAKEQSIRVSRITAPQDVAPLEIRNGDILLQDFRVALFQLRYSRNVDDARLLLRKFNPLWLFSVKGDEEFNLFCALVDNLSSKKLTGARDLIIKKERGL